MIGDMDNLFRRTAQQNTVLAQDVSEGMVIRLWDSHDWGMVLKIGMNVFDRRGREQYVSYKYTLCFPDQPDGPKWISEADYDQAVQVLS